MSGPAHAHPAGGGDAAAGAPAAPTAPAAPGHGAKEPTPFGNASYQKQQAEHISRDVAGGRDARQPHQATAPAPGDEESAFVSFGRAQGLSGAHPGSGEEAGPSSPRTAEGPAAPTRGGRAAAAAAQRRPGRWLRACFCLAAEPEAADMPTRHDHDLGGAPSLRPRRTLSKQVSLYAGPRRTISGVKSTYSDAQWFDALSRFDSLDGGDVTNDDVEALLRDSGDVIAAGAAGDVTAAATAAAGAGAAGGQLVHLAPSVPRPLPAVQAPGPFVPDPPLEMADKAFVFVPVPQDTGFGGYWLKDHERTTPNPQPIDVMLGASRMAMKAHETIPGIWLSDSPTSLTMTAKPRSIPLGPLSRYVETFAKDGSTTYWTMRRDIRVGRSSGQMYFTACGTLIFRVYAKGVWSNEPEYVTEEYSRLEDEGNTIVSRQCCKHYASGQVAVQYLVGDWTGLEPPPGHI